MRGRPAKKVGRPKKQAIEPESEGTESDNIVTSPMGILTVDLNVTGRGKSLYFLMQKISRVKQAETCHSFVIMHRDM